MENVKDKIHGILLELVKLQNNREYNELNERILDAQDKGGLEHEASDLFEKYYANEGYAKWHEDNSDKSDDRLDN